LCENHKNHEGTFRPEPGQDDQIASAQGIVCINLFCWRFYMKDVSKIRIGKHLVGIIGLKETIADVANKHR
jgi:hypothetical protein